MTPEPAAPAPDPKTHHAKVSAAVRFLLHHHAKKIEGEDPASAAEATRHASELEETETEPAPPAA